MAETSDINIDLTIQTDDSSVFVDVSEKQNDIRGDKPCPKPRRKRNRVLDSNDTSIGSESHVLDTVATREEEEEGECEKSVEEREEGDVEGQEETLCVSEGLCLMNTEQYLLRELNSLKTEIETLKSENNLFKTKVTTIVTEVVAEVKDRWMDEVVALVRNERKYVDEIQSSVLDMDRALKDAVSSRQPSGQLQIDRVSEEVFDRVVMVESQVIDLEARSRRNNLIIHGLEEKDNEDCRDVVLDFIDRGCCVDQRVVMERVHRIGRKRTRTAKPYPRPMIVKFLDCQDKQLVKGGGKHLPKHIYMTDDFPLAVRQARKQLAGDLSDARRSSTDAYIRYPAVLVVDGVIQRTVDPVSEPANRYVHTDRDKNNNNNYLRQQNNNINKNTNDPTNDDTPQDDVTPWSTVVHDRRRRRSTDKDHRNANSQEGQRGAQDARTTGHQEGERSRTDAPRQFGRASATGHGYQRDAPRHFGRPATATDSGDQRGGNSRAPKRDARVPKSQRNNNSYRR